MSKEKKPEFKDRYVLGEGYPWALGVAPYTDLQLQETPTGSKPVELDWPAELWKRDIPKYRLVLEKVKP